MAQSITGPGQREGKPGGVVGEIRDWQRRQQAASKGGS